MPKKKKISEEASDLRERAEEKAGSSPPENMDRFLSGETQRNLHELRVHQIELEMQNEELRNSQSELDAVRARYFDLYDLAPVGYCTISEKGLILEGNLTVSTMLGVPRNLLARRLLSQFILKEDHDIYYLHRKRLLEANIPQSFELRMLKEDGTVFWAYLAATAGQDSSGAPLCRIVISDITGRKDMEETFIRVSQEWQRTFDFMSESVWIMDEDNIVLRSNKAAELYFNRPSAEMVGKHCWEIVHGTLEPIPECPITRVRKSLHRESTELQIGGTFFQVAVDPILDAGGQFAGAVHVVANITGRKKAEHERAKLEAQLRQSQKMEAIGQLAGGIAHDFNNMLSIITGYSKLALKALDPSAPNYAHLKAILDAGQHSADLTRQLLAFARKQVVAPKALDLNDTIAGMLKMLQRLIGENIQLLWEPAVNLWKIKMDPSQIDQILANMLVNARDAISDVGKVTIETCNAELDEAFCKAYPDSVPGKYVVLSVSDNGCGMEKKTLEHIFEPFFTTKEVGKGTGLGLATVFGIVKQISAEVLSAKLREARAC